MATIPEPPSASVEIDIPAEQLPPWLVEILLRPSGTPWPYVDLTVARARFLEPVTVETTGGVVRFKATLHAESVEFFGRTTE